MAKRKSKAASKRDGQNGANLGFQKTLWLAADKLRNNIDAAEYKHVVLGLIFLKYISDGLLHPIVASSINMATIVIARLAIGICSICVPPTHNTPDACVAQIKQARSTT